METLLDVWRSLQASRRGIEAIRFDQLTDAQRREYLVAIETERAFRESAQRHGYAGHKESAA